MKCQSWQVGQIRITQITEIEAGSIIRETLPLASCDEILKIPWLYPDFADIQGNLKAVVQAFVVETSGHCILIDPCIGNAKPRKDIPAWGDLQTDFLEKLGNAGYPREKIDLVLCTHLHFDHVGWNTIYENGKWLPTFPKARYLFAEQEFRYWKTRPEKELADDNEGFKDSVLPVFEAGLAELIQTNEKISTEVSLIPTPGHTPAHVSVHLESAGEKAIITGDVLHHPCQLAHPEWETTSDSYKAQACRTRRILLEQVADTKTLVVGSHFAPPTAGRVLKDGKVFRLTPASS